MDGCFGCKNFASPTPAKSPTRPANCCCLVGEDSRIPVFPDRLVAEAGEGCGDSAWLAFVGDVELTGGVGGPFAGVADQLPDAAALIC